MASTAAVYGSYLVWPAIISLPLVLTTNDLYKQVFPQTWYDESPKDFYTILYHAEGDASHWPSPLGLSLGLGAVVVGQFFMLLYFIYIARVAGKTADSVNKKNDDLSANDQDTNTRDNSPTSVTAEAESSAKNTSSHSSSTAMQSTSYFIAIQKEGARPYDLSEGLMTHLAQPEGFVMLGGYLIGTWMFGLMPASYYNFTVSAEGSLVTMILLIRMISSILTDSPPISALSLYLSITYISSPSISF